MIKAAVPLGVVVLCVGMAMHPPAGAGSPARAPILLGVAWVAFALAVYLLPKPAQDGPADRPGWPGWRLAGLVLGGAVALQLAAGFAPPRSSDDVYRYVWDGRIQAAGTDPYRYPPAAAELRGHRDPDFLWSPDGRWVTPEGDRTVINRPAVPTIYPPVAEAYFTAVHWLAPAGSRTGPLQIGAGLFGVLTAGLLLAAGAGRGAALWAWCPTVAVEAANNAHVDVLAAGLAALSLVLLSRRRTWAGGAVLGLAIATKVTPGLVLPAVGRWWRVGVAAVVAVVLVYAPHVIAVGPKVLGYLPGYLKEEGYAGGRRFALVTMFVPASWAPVVAVLVLAAVAVAVMRRADTARPWAGAAVMVGSALLISAPGYPWYATLLVVLVAGGGRPEWLTVAVAGYLVQYANDLGLDPADAQRIGYGVALATVLAAAFWRATRGGADRATVAGSTTQVLQRAS